MRSLTLTALAMALALPPVTHAQDLVYTPVNPSFGGNPFNSSHLLSIAEIHRPEEDRETSSLFGSSSLSQADRFTRQLESRILSQISFDIVDKIFNGEAQTGTFQFDQTTLSFDRLLDGRIELVIVDATTGGSTTILVPSFLTDN